ncbi:MAG: hypothetical protein KME56_13830 [Candidatus Thiodiazotropha sp. (ex Ctena orbiculata)]|uniref:Uncharacterized protein n=1 Tax=Candidatus Thiodiazotropha taylori TaxID=2792791 RepID=A0A944M6E6_9GAMM|nr:hypothetical protein [Candidatus Thiodiazotropha taylori]PUB88974.1 MAG: hypothetical protein DBP00_03835 [gamma proteobacterium symbiont of Ctena orbiculata]MBT2988049.1 hypothetical protein [Candidatus Thiodiazotropha taylori]MBT2997686.1 hypothetical protein [Candidatus Thiodiazotropha taylori]MBT3001893.1 hypothetical protein [Candidatus Thiodiazotropha taylori]
MKEYSEQRIGMGPIPTEPKYYLNREQVNGLAVLRKFGWRIVCIRRPSLFETTTIMLHKNSNKLGVLGIDGILRITDNIKIRDKTKNMRDGESPRSHPLQFRKSPR